MKVKFWLYMSSNGDGSVSALFFKSEKDAEKYAEKDDERFCDDIYSKELEFDENGVLLNPSIIDEDEEDSDI